MPFKDECGVFGVFECDNAAELCYLGLYALQHRGQEACGIVSSDAKCFHVVKDKGLVSDVFHEDQFRYLKGRSAIGHVRYSTAGSNCISNVQPLYSKTAKGNIAISHNGNLTNATDLGKNLRDQGALFQSTVDSEIILHLVSKSVGDSIIECFRSVLSSLEGAFSMVAMGDDYLLAARDRFGFRPLVLATLENGYIVSSETCALDLIGASYVREIDPGEILFIETSTGKLTSVYLGESESVVRKACIFEYIYFSRPDSVVFGNGVHEVRRRFGHQLAKEHPVDEADIVMSIPDSGNSSALGYSKESGIPFDMGMTRNHYVGRTFINNHQTIRDFKVKVKLNPVRSVIEGQSVVVVDDSLVRGTTSKQRISALRMAGARKIHLRIAAPQVLHPCYFGIDTPSQKDLISANKSIDEICKYVGADSLGFLSKEGMLSALEKDDPNSFCTACFDGNYPMKVRNKGKYSFDSEFIHFYS